MPGPPSSSRRARNKWPGRSPTSQSRTCGAGHQRLRHRRLRRLHVDPYRRFRRRKRGRKRARQCHCGPDNSSRHRRRRRHVQHASASLKIFVRHPFNAVCQFGAGHWIGIGSQARVCSIGPGPSARGLWSGEAAGGTDDDRTADGCALGCEGVGCGIEAACGAGDGAWTTPSV